MAEHLLEVKSLKKRFRILKHLWYDWRVAVKDVSLHVDEGEIVCLLGPNGAGKSTSLKMISGDLTPDEGSVFFNGQDISSFPMYKRCLNGLGYLAQENTLFKNLTVEQNLIGVMEMLGYSRTECRQRCEELIEMFELSHLRNSPALRLSGGERRRLEVARALTKKPKLIILDEPFAGVDPKIIGKVQDLIELLSVKWNIAILITDHNVTPVADVSDRGYVIAQGGVIYDGSVEGLLKDPNVKDVYLGDGVVSLQLSGRHRNRIRVNNKNYAVDPKTGLLDNDSLSDQERRTVEIAIAQKNLPVSEQSGQTEQTKPIQFSKQTENSTYQSTSPTIDTSPFPNQSPSEGYFTNPSSNNQTLNETSSINPSSNETDLSELLEPIQTEVSADNQMDTESPQTLAAFINKTNEKNIENRTTRPTEESNRPAALPSADNKPDGNKPNSNKSDGSKSESNNSESTAPSIPQRKPIASPAIKPFRRPKR